MSTNTATPLQVADYHVLTLRLPRLPSRPHTSHHHLYLRPHEPKIPHPDSLRSLFVANIPADSSSLHFRSLLTDQLGGGRLERVDFENAPTARKVDHPRLKSTGSKNRKRKRGAEDTDAVLSSLPEIWDRELHSSGSTAIAVFADRPSMELAFKAARRVAKSGTSLKWGKGHEDEIPDLGSHRYLQHHILQYPDVSTLQASVDAYMTAFAALEASRSQALIRQRSVPDADGFITVTRGARTGPARLQETQDKADELKKKEEEKQKGMSNFYRFQQREKRKEEAGQLVKRFEEDRRRVEEMRRGRGNRFKPV